MKVDELLALLGKWIAVPPQAPQQQQQPLSEQDKNQFSDLVFGSYAGYAALMETDSTRKILEGLDAKEFYEPRRLRVLVSSISNFQNIAQVWAFAEVHGFYEKLKSLHKMDATCRTLLETGKVGDFGPLGIVQLELADYDDMGIEPERLLVFVTTVRDLHTNLARLLGIDNSSLRFKYFDSGSSVLVGIQCVKEISKTIGDLMLQWWDKIKFADFDTLDRKIEAVERAAAMAEKMKIAIQNGTVDEETGRNLTRRIFQELDELVGIGVTPPLESEATVNQRELILAKRNLKLLETGQQPKLEEQGSGTKSNL